MPDPRVEELVAAWCVRDHASALVPADHAAIDATTGARAFIMEQLLAGGNADLFHGCLVLGRLIAGRGGSSTLVASTIDGALDVLPRLPAERGDPRAWLPFARAALLEGYDAERAEASRKASCAAWDYPHCAVRVDAETMAFAASLPNDDADVVSDWAARLALAAQRAGVRRAIVSGRDAPRRALIDALSLAGIELVPPQDGPGRPRDDAKAPLLSWLRRRG